VKHVVIEDASIELLELFDKVSKESKIEKNAVPPINKMIYWWTRKPLIVGRAMALASTLDNIDDVKSFLGFNSEKRAYQYVPDVSKYKQKLGQDPGTIKVLDPFGGAGSLAFTAVQLGLDVTVSDYNPLAYLIEKSVLEYPAKYGANLATDVEKYAKLVIEKTTNEVGRFFKENQLTYLWAWCIKCHHCGQRVPLANHMYIVNTPKKKIGIKIIPRNGDFTVELVPNISESDGKKFTQKGGSAVCISCTNPINYKILTEDISKRKDREMIVIQVQKTKGRDYVIPTKEDKKLYQESVKYFNSKKKEFENDNLIPVEDIHHDPRSPLKNYGITHWNQFYDERQLLVLATFLKNIREVCKSIEDKEYRGVITLYLAAILAKRVDVTAFGVRWNAMRETTEAVLSMRQPRIIYNFGESNPFEQIRGGLEYLTDNIIEGISFANRLQNIAKCNLESVTVPSKEKYDLILTDPPYGDDVVYGEISEFFYLWVYRALKDYFPELPPRAPLDEDFCESWGRFGTKQLAADFFAKGLKKSFVSLSDKLKDDGLLVVFFAHSSTEAWNLFLEAIRAARFEVVSSYSIHTEMISNVISRGKTSFMSSIVVSCRKLNKESTAYLEDIIPKAEDEIKKMLDKITNDKLLLLPITDLLIMVYGKVLETCTQHTVLKSYQKKDKEPDFEDLVKDSRDFILKQIIDKITDNKMNQIGPVMSFYLLLKVFYQGAISADEAIKITQTYNVEPDSLYKINVAVKEKGSIRLTYLQENKITLKPEDLDPDNLHQQLCYLGTIAQTKSASDILSVFRNKENIRIDELKQIISIILKSYNLRRNKGDALDADEQEELKIFEKLADILGVEHGGVLDSFMEKE